MSGVKVHIIGRLGADAEVKQTKQGKDFSTFTIAVDDYVQGKRETTWFAVADFTDVARRRAEFLKKGTMIEVQGLETCRVYMDRNNLPQIARDIRATHIDFIHTNNKQEDEKNSSSAEAQSKTTNATVQQTVQNPQPQVVATVASADVEDDLPF